MGRAFEVRKASMAKTAAKKTKIYSKYGREIYVAARDGSPDPETNVALKRVIDRAKKDQVPADIIKRAIEKAKGGVDETYQQVRYEGFGPEGSLFVVECLTDNVNRTVAEVRNCFTKTDGKLGVSGSVVFQFNHYAAFVIEDETEDSIFEILIENDVDIVEIDEEDGAVAIYAEIDQFAKVKSALLTKVSDEKIASEAIMWIPMSEIEIKNEDEKAKFDRLCDMLEDLDDVTNFYHNVKLG